MADNLDSLTDAKIREQLKLLGVEAGPITPSTRSVWLKKLKFLRLGQSNATSGKAKQRRSVGTSSPGRARTKLSGFSSDEEEFPLKKTQSYPAGPKSSASRRRSAFPRSNHVENEERDDTDDTSLGDTVGSKYKLLQRRSLPRSYIQESELYDTLPGGAKNGPNPMYEKEVTYGEQERPTLRKYSFELEDKDADGVLRKVVGRTARQDIDKEDQKIRASSKLEASTTTVRRRQVAGDFMDTAKVNEDNDCKSTSKLSPSTREHYSSTCQHFARNIAFSFKLEFVIISFRNLDFSSVMPC